MTVMISVAVAIMAGLLMTRLTNLFRLPDVTAYLIAGVVIGPYCLGALGIDGLGFTSFDAIDALGSLSNLALGFIAFAIGNEFRLSQLKNTGRQAAVIGVVQAITATLFVDAALIGMHFVMPDQISVPAAITLGAIATATAPAATLMVVKQYKARGELTDTLLAVVAIDDATALMFFGISTAIAKSIDRGGAESLLLTILKPLGEILASLALGAVIGFIYRWLVKWFTGRGNRLAATYAMVFACVGLGEMLGLSALLICMMLGAMLANTSRECDVIFEMTDRMTPPIFMLFFFLSGAGLDLTILPEVGLVGIVYVLFRVVGKVSGAWIGGKICHATPKTQKYLGFALVPQAGVAIGLATTAMTIVPEYGTRIRTIILCGTVIYELTGPVITKLALKKAGEIEA